MRRRIDLDPKPFFRGAELPRLMTMVVMLAVIAMLFTRARDPRTWAMFGAASEVKAVAGDEEVPPPEYESPPADKSTSTPLLGAEDPSTKEPPPGEAPLSSDSQIPPPAKFNLPKVPALDEDLEERDALAEELQVVTDKEALDKIEMPAYYRLLRWTLSQPLKEMERKAIIKDPRFGDIFTRPDFYRGKLVDIDLHVRRVLKHSDIEKDNPAGVTKMWEVFGYNDSSMPNSYICMTPELPPKMPVGGSVAEEGRFVGYFFKLMSYKDGQDKMRASPVFIGRFIWDPPILQKADPKAQERELMWGLLAVAVVGLFMAVRWGMRQLRPKSAKSFTDTTLREMRRRWALEKDSDEENIDIETWLDRNEATPGDTAINRSPEDESDDESNGQH